MPNSGKPEFGGEGCTEYAAGMITHIHTEADLDRGIAALIALDPRFAAVLERGGRPPLRRRDGGYAGLAQIIVSQQVSVASAAAIHGRLVAIADPFDHAAVLRARKDKLLRVGLSNAKIKTLKEIAKAIEKQHIDLDALADIAGRRRACAADATARHRPVDRGRLSARLPRPCRRVAGRRYRPAGGRARRLRPVARGRRPRRWARSPIPGGPGARSRRGCCGPTIAP